MIVVNKTGLNPITFKQGEDITLSIPILDSINYPVDISVCPDITADLRVNNDMYAQYSIVVRPNYGTIIVDAVYNNVLQLKITREQSKKFPPGRVSAVLLLKFLDAFGQPKREEYTVELGNVIKGLTTEQTAI